MRAVANHFDDVNGASRTILRACYLVVRRPPLAVILAVTLASGCARRADGQRHNPEGGAPGDAGDAGDAPEAGGGAGSGGADAEAVGYLPATVAPLSIPPPPANGRLQLCDSMASPLPFGFLADGRALIAQRSVDDGERLIRAWDLRRNVVETLFVAWARPEDSTLQVSGDGRYVFVRRDQQTPGASYQIFDVARGAFLAADAIRVAAVAISWDGRFVLDDRARRLTAAGDVDFDFAPLSAVVAPMQTRWDPGFMAFSPSADAVAVRTLGPAGRAPAVLVAYEDGRAFTLEDRRWARACLVSSCSRRTETASCPPDRARCACGRSRLGRCS